MINYISLAISCLLVSNVVLTQFLGICPFLGVSKNKKLIDSWGNRCSNGDLMNKQR